MTSLRTLLVGILACVIDASAIDKQSVILGDLHAVVACPSGGLSRFTSCHTYPELACINGLVQRTSEQAERVGVPTVVHCSDYRTPMHCDTAPSGRCPVYT
ncbi:uncharacterized protein L969DRAFT_94332 [Mixia osmundae IAM 14324]|uniref:Secreted protein n=1 Tax=Mixia osmundae (strain CBS 9802 / IAM 14324 / JCM 22182 / KY 12970) TaxID=764103 RepID=G7DZS4_MIXOS|nr:uncharacterized protein L969DRAFT_94332 [Mixia osmundae IAM 14324]KEI39257.1 hypothetical protein L969DRAFT_94332 [Mixia osmundae IAM 14324]GAA96084.1 hypothetical protein E5Q_02745 [Mixia osmundae IAM 14324]